MNGDTGKKCQTNLPGSWSGVMALKLGALLLYRSIEDILIIYCVLLLYCNLVSSKHSQPSVKKALETRKSKKMAQSLINPELPTSHFGPMEEHRCSSWGMEP